MEKVNQQNPLLPTCMADAVLILQIRCPHLLPYVCVPCDVRRPKENYTNLGTTNDQKRLIIIITLL